MTDDYIKMLGFEVSNSALYAFAVSFSYIIIALTSPLLSGMADYSGKRMHFLKFFTYLGSFSCMALFFFDGMPRMALGLLAFILATIGHAGSLVFYNAYLPEIVSEDRLDRLSAKGYAWGYIGSVILLIVNLIVITFPHWFGLEGTVPVRLAFLCVGLWWLGFAQITFSKMPKTAVKEQSANIFSKGYQELIKVWNSVKGIKNIKFFLYAFFFYSAGVHTVIY